MNYQTDIISILNLIVLTLTLFAVGYYAKMARDQIKELVRQRRLSTQPTLLPQVKMENGKDVFYLTNIGKGIAINIKIRDVHFFQDIIVNWYYKFDDVPMLQPKETISINIYDIQEGDNKGRPKDLVRFKKQFGPSKTLTVLIQFNFQDIEGENYEQIFQMGDVNKHIHLKVLK